MADISVTTPLLASNDNPDDTNALNNSEDENSTLALPANAHIKRPVKIMTICVSIASVLGAIFLTASFIVVQDAPFATFPPFYPPFPYTYGARYVLQELGTCVIFISFILSTFTLFLELPIIVNLLIDLILTILVLIYAGNIFGQAWPDNNWCYNFRNPEYANYTQCIRWREASRILMGIGGGLGFLIGIFYLILLLLLAVAISRTKFWKRILKLP